MEHFNRLQQKLWQKVEPRPGMKLSLSTLAETQTTHRKKKAITTQNVQTNPFILPPYNTNATVTLFYVVTLAVCFLRLPVKTSSLSDHVSKVTANNGALSKQIYAKVWTDNGGSQRLVFIKPHSCSPYPQPLCTQSNLCHSVPQTNKCCLCFSLTPLFCLYKYFFFYGTDAFLFSFQTNCTVSFLSLEQ